MLIDCVLTVAVTIAAGVAAIVAPPQWRVNRVKFTLAFVVVSMIETCVASRIRRIFAAPAYFFVVDILSLIAVGTWRVLAGIVTGV